MTTVNAYINFNGNCEEAFNFYKSIFGGEFPYLGRYKDMPVQEGMPSCSEGMAEKIMHVYRQIWRKLDGKFPDGSTAIII